jgi:hypothetical protein
MTVGVDVIVYGQRTRVKEVSPGGAVSFTTKIKLPCGNWTYYLGIGEVSAIKPVNV